MIDAKSIFGHIDAGELLDVATGAGNFIALLREGLRSYTSILGIDNSDRAATAFEQAFKDQAEIRFQKGDFLSSSFPSERFDTVSVSNSLHHFEDPVAVMAEIQRVLKPGGTAILSEMYSDVTEPTQLTHVLMHHWWGEVDSATGTYHGQTYKRAELRTLFETVAWTGLREAEFLDTDSDPKDPELLAQLEGIIDSYEKKAEGYPALRAKGEDLRKRVRQIGYHNATCLVLVARKKLG